MITKSYSIMCDKCTKTEGLFGQSLKDCKPEAENMGWFESKKNWYCNECYEFIKSTNKK